jgi:hypothetical protein
MYMRWFLPTYDAGDEHPSSNVRFEGTRRGFDGLSRHTKRIKDG